MKNWAAHLVGAPYRTGADGPEEFDCVGLVRHYFRARHGLDLPDYHLTDREGLLQFVRATGWARTRARPQHDDVAVMDGPTGRHTGVLVESSEGLGLLHAVGTDRQGQVVWQPLDSLIGYRNIEIWRPRA
jgi:cell wall-associated NlpC family hydrolase